MWRKTGVHTIKEATGKYFAYILLQKGIICKNKGLGKKLESTSSKKTLANILMIFCYKKRFLAKTISH